ncbi:WD40/YVTN/BNR-like repeat-containing protein [Flavilitoribacter nigricans]|nr:glycosyl hydrolase [Flavilitoribacter nigricans]
MNRVVRFLAFILCIGSLGFNGCQESSDLLQAPSSDESTPHSPEDWMYRQRAYPHGRIRKDIYLQAMHQWQALRNARSGGQQDWEPVGPLAIGGRITSLAVDPTDDQTIFIGAASGGVFKTTNGGQNWSPVFDGAASLSIGDLALAPSDPQIIYVGTGEANAGGGSLAYDGAGIYKSTDGGTNWTPLGLENSGSTGKMIVHPQNPDRVYVATMGELFANNSERGLYRTINGGQSWEQVLYISDSTGVIDLAIHPDQLDILFAASWERIRRPNRRQYGGTTSAIYRSNDGGDSWQQLSLPIAPNRRLGRIGLAISPVNPNRIYASVVDGDNDLLLGIYRSDNLGQSWTDLPLDGISQVPFMWWFGKIYADPVDADRVYICGLEVEQYRLGDEQWETIMRGSHVDQHVLYIEPDNASYLLLGNDGGLYRGTGDFTTTWTHFDNLPITQFYTAEIDFQQPSRLFGGTQDNGSLRRRTDSGQWEQILGGDGFVNLVDPSDPRFVYAESQYGNFRRSTSGGNQFSNGTPIESLSENRNWKTPVILDPNTPSTLYYGAQRVFRSTDRAVNWQAISPILANTPPGSNLVYGSITSLAVSPANSSVLYAGTDEGSLFLTTNDGNDWEPIDQNLPGRWITSISAHPTDQRVAYVTFSGYRWNDYLPHVFRTDDQGQTWTDISAGLPEVPVNDIVIRPDRPEELFLATDAGVFRSEDEGLSWSVLGQSLPKVVVNDLVYHQPTQTLVAGTYGRSMYQITIEDSPLAVDQQVRGLIQSARAFPNPFREQSRIRIVLEKAENLNVGIYQLDGRLVQTLHEGQLAAGVHEFSFRAGGSGSYICRIIGRESRATLLLSRL